MQISFGSYVVTDAPEHMQPQAVYAMLSQTYWAKGRSYETMLRSFERSVCFGVYHGEQQAAFARVVSDYATVYWLCDVVVHTEHQGRGLGKALVRAVTEDPRFAGLTGILATNDAHGLYSAFGFKPEAQRFMWTR